MDVRAVVVDFDGTIAGDQGVLDNPQLIAIFRHLRAAGVKVVLNTGRDLDYVMGDTGLTRPEHVNLFDAIIVENGGAVWYPGSNAPTPLTTLRAGEIVSELRRVKVPARDIWTGYCAVMTRREHMPKVDRALRAINHRRAASGQRPLLLDPIVNNASVTYLPPGVNKGSALLQVVNDILGVPPANVLGAGDGNNDIAFLSLCGAAIVPRNANPRVKALGNAIHADGDNAAGLVEVLSAVIRNGMRIDPPSRTVDRAVA